MSTSKSEHFGLHLWEAGGRFYGQRSSMRIFMAIDGRPLGRVSRQVFLEGAGDGGGPTSKSTRLERSGPVATATI